MKGLIILTNLFLTSSLLVGTTGGTFNIPYKEFNIGIHNDFNQEETSEKSTTTYIVVKEKNAAVAKAEKLAKEEAERKAKEEAERLAKEAERKAEEERLAREEAERQEQNSQYVVDVYNERPETNHTSSSQSSRNEVSTVRGITVDISDSVSNSDYNTFINWVNNMPSFLLEHVTHIYVVDNIASYNPTGSTVSGFANGNKIYVNANKVSGRLGTLYHEAAHILDRYNGYSESSTWKDICASEWSGEGHYSSSLESFAEAVSRYYVDGLSKPQSKAAIKNLVNTGNLGSGQNGDGFTETNITLYGGYRAVYLYSTPSDRVGQELLLPVGSTVQAIGVNSDASWYKVSYEGNIYYTPSYLISLNPQ